MRFAAVIALAFGLAPASGLRLYRSDQRNVQRSVDDDDLDVPGKSPLKYCREDRADDIIKIESVDLLPNPPEAGAELIINAVGTVYETIEEGAYVNLQVKYGLIRLVNTRADLCEQIKNVDLECPIEKGLISITKAVNLPKEIPPGKYTVEADVYTLDDEHITCLKATVVFGRKDSSSFFDL
ncbi:ML domain-containing protein [Phialemonium atrogriseum]|uniref:Phosphatidylglycerol/phosphatidylinositol transfer protein n=1 Tax=Phialemonium atrogriseum TaxID=1093897 RepID=A0AAJ0C756_9PEZI|nr:ML domain-containing protein [Phialemonium atrogriseum]KAK1771383.1 ML domain-containing protein [Phialemonium atrogriseum]